MYRILYILNGIHHSLTMRHYSASSAYSAAGLMVMPGSKLYGIEVAA
jgi:hypothetical protein